MRVRVHFHIKFGKKIHNFMRDNDIKRQSKQLEWKKGDKIGDRNFLTQLV